MPRRRRTDYRQYFMTLDNVRIGSKLTAGGGPRHATSMQVDSISCPPPNPSKNPEKKHQAKLFSMLPEAISHTEG